MLMDEGLDTGPVFTQRAIPISERCTGGELTEQLAELAVTVIRDDLPVVTRGVVPQAQDEERATHAPPIQKEHLLLHFEKPALNLERQVRAFAPTPGAFCFLGPRRLKILEAEPVDGATSNAAPGTVTVARGDLLWVQTGDGVLAIGQAQLEGKRIMNTRDLINGRMFTPGLVLGQAPTS
jgi:methionyl-tRNA formyltransferase